MVIKTTEEQCGTRGCSPYVCSIHIAPTDFVANLNFQIEYLKSIILTLPVDQSGKRGQFVQMCRLRFLIFSLVSLFAVTVSAGPIVAHFQSGLGDFDVLLDPATAPLSVLNFSDYANRGAYDNTLIHRSTTQNPFDIQIIQGGGFELVVNTIVPVPTALPILLEAGEANVRGTLAVARTSEPNSATSQWYFNVTDNPGLDFNYAVFGRVLGGGLEVIDAIAGVTAYNASQLLGPTFRELPLFGPELIVENLVLVDSVRVEPFAITGVTHGRDSVEIRWTPLSAKTPVRVERTGNIGHGSWTVVSSNNTTGIFNDTNAPTGRAFYRVVTE